jgi:hypothetical protein
LPINSNLIDVGSRESHQAGPALPVPTISTSQPGKSPHFNADLLVFVSARDIKRNTTFEPIRLTILEYAQLAVNEARRRMTEDDDDDDDEIFSDGSEPDDEDSDNIVVKRYKFGIAEFNLLTERIGSQMGDFIIKLDLFDGHLSIRTVPGAPHGIAVGLFTEMLMGWAKDANTQGVQGNPLRCAADASMCLLVFR